MFKVYFIALVFCTTRVVRSFSLPFLLFGEVRRGRSIYEIPIATLHQRLYSSYQQKFCFVLP